MPTFQNPGLTQDPSLILGSVKAEVATAFGGSYVNVGLGRSFAIAEEVTLFSVQVDNGPDPIEGIAEHELAISMELVELYLPTLAIIRGGVDLEAVVSAAAVSGATQTIASPFVANLRYEIDNQNGAGTALAAFTSVVGGTDGTLTADDDFHQVDETQADGSVKTGIVMNTVAGGTNLTTLAQDVVITYDYTPNASRSLSTGGLATISSRSWRLTNRQIVEGSSLDRIIDVYTAFFEGGTSITFNSDQADDPLTVVPLAVRGKLDSSRTDGDQLFKITDEVGTA